MKTAAWHKEHLAAGDKALEDAGTLLIRFPNELEIERANALIALARAHYRACEVDAVLQVTP